MCISCIRRPDVKESYPNPTPTPPAEKNKLYERSMAQITDQVSAIKTHTESSKSELFWRGKRHFKVWQFSVIFRDIWWLAKRRDVKEAFASPHLTSGRLPAHRDVKGRLALTSGWARPSLHVRTHVTLPMPRVTAKERVLFLGACTSFPYVQ